MKIIVRWTFLFPISIHKIDKEWKVLHQHGSYPDAKTEEGEDFAVDEIKVEIQSLPDQSSLPDETLTPTWVEKVGTEFIISLAIT